MHRVVAAALVGPAGVLMAKRRLDLAHAPGLWSFPGGHIEPGETEQAALERELREELGVWVSIEGDPLIRSAEGEGPERLEMSIWVIHRWEGTPSNSAVDENDEVRWVRNSELSDAELAHPTCRPILKRYAP